MSDAEEARQDAEQFDCAVAGEVADLEGRSELSMPGCQANASKVIEAAAQSVLHQFEIGEIRSLEHMAIPRC